jgi:hypothetical protein
MEENITKYTPDPPKKTAGSVPLFLSEKLK